jgi:hypothetical protein
MEEEQESKPIIDEKPSTNTLAQAVTISLY